MSASAPAFVLDSHAILVYFNDLPGSDRVEALLESAQAHAVSLHMSLINVGELFCLAYRRRSQRSPD